MLETGTLFVETFVCKKCGVPKLASEFVPEKRNLSGLSGTCRECSNARSREWHLRNPERRKEVRLLSAERNQDSIKISRQRYAERNVEITKERRTIWALEHPETIRLSRAEWVVRNPDKVALNRLNQAEKKRAATKARRGAGWPKETEDGRWCQGCTTRKPRSDFAPLTTKRRGSGLQNYCRECANEKAMTYNQTLSPQAKYHRGRKASLKKNYGLTLEAYETLVASQGHACAICRSPIKDWKVGDSLAARSASVDHDHESGVVRGILCVKCNAGLGQFRDDVSLLAAAIGYLDRARATAIVAMANEDTEEEGKG